MGITKNMVEDKTDPDGDSVTSVSIDAVERMQTIGKALKLHLEILF